jgi:hypothetical protein
MKTVGFTEDSELSASLAGKNFEGTVSAVNSPIQGMMTLTDLKEVESSAGLSLTPGTSASGGQAYGFDLALICPYIGCDPKKLKEKVRFSVDRESTVFAKLSENAFGSSNTNKRLLAIKASAEIVNAATTSTVSTRNTVAAERFKFPPVEKKPGVNLCDGKELDGVNIPCGVNKNNQQKCCKRPLECAFTGGEDGTWECRQPTENRCSGALACGPTNDGYRWCCNQNQECGSGSGGNFCKDKPGKLLPDPEPTDGPGGGKTTKDCPEGQDRCFDGECRTKTSCQCLSEGKGSDCSVVCPCGTAADPSGICVPAGLEQEVVKGECVNKCPVNTTRCEDGNCRGDCTKQSFDWGDCPAPGGSCQNTCEGVTRRDSALCLSKCNPCSDFQKALCENITNAVNNCLAACQNDCAGQNVQSGTIKEEVDAAPGATSSGP